MLSTNLLNSYLIQKYPEYQDFFSYNEGEDDVSIQYPHLKLIIIDEKNPSISPNFKNIKNYFYFKMSDNLHDLEKLNQCVENCIMYWSNDGEFVIKRSQYLKLSILSDNMRLSIIIREIRNSVTINPSDDTNIFLESNIYNDLKAINSSVYKTIFMWKDNYKWIPLKDFIDLCEEIGVNANKLHLQKWIIKNIDSNQYRFNHYVAETNHYVTKPNHYAMESNRGEFDIKMNWFAMYQMCLSEEVGIEMKVLIQLFQKIYYSILSNESEFIKSKISIMKSRNEDIKNYFIE